MATYVIGDVHGCYYSLMKLLEKLGYCDNDRLCFVGDLVNRGVHSRKVLEFVSSREHCINVLGNHDLYLLAVYYGHERYSGGDNFSDVLEADNVDFLMEWLGNCDFIHVDEINRAVMVHAGLPNWSLDAIVQRHGWLKQKMNNLAWRRMFLSDQLMGNKPKVWKDCSDDTQKARLLVNFFTRMRYCSPKGSIQFNFKGTPDSAPEKMLPWYEFWSEKRSHTLLFGHWSALPDIRVADHIFNLDTGCAWGGLLTAYCLEDRHDKWSAGQIIQVNNHSKDGTK